LEGDSISASLSFAPVAAPPGVNQTALQQLLWDSVGIVRSGVSLAKAAGILAAWQDCLPEPCDRGTWELRNLIVSGRLMTEAALKREESRGAHFRTDYPDQKKCWRRHILMVKEGD
jgi:L-aspartate oxidase